MTRLLLDTHALLWFVANDAALSASARSLIESSADEVFVSVASAWEIAIKVNLGKLSLDAASAESFFEEQMRANGFAYLPRGVLAEVPRLDGLHTVALDEGHELDGRIKAEGLRYLGERTWVAADLTLEPPRVGAMAGELKDVRSLKGQWFERDIVIGDPSPQAPRVFAATKDLGHLGQLETMIADSPPVGVERPSQTLPPPGAPLRTRRSVRRRRHAHGARPTLASPTQLD